VIRRLPSITPQFIARLDAVSFFDYFFPKTLESVYAQAQDAAVMLVDTMARITWAQGYIYFITYLPSLLMAGGFLAQKGLIAAIVLAKAPNAEGTYAPAIPYFIRVNLAEALIRCTVDPQYDAYRQGLLQTIQYVAAQM
jgi:hypothetical protein